MKKINRSNIFKVLSGIIISLIIILIGINILYIKTACSTKQCVITNLSTIALLLWIVIFWFVIWRSIKDK